MSYAVKEIFYSLQGEGTHAGRPAVFLRFTGCDRWSGLEADRVKGRGCSAWCDTDFRGTDGSLGGRYYISASLASACAELWPSGYCESRFVVLTGGEPMLQVDTVLIDALHRFGCQVAIETNGGFVVPDSVDWITVSPKAGAELKQTRGQELKLVWPQEGIDPASFLGLAFDRFYLQPRSDVETATETCLAYCVEHPAWRLSLQTHKLLQIR